MSGCNSGRRSHLNESPSKSCTAFAGTSRIACGGLQEVALKAKATLDRDKHAQVLIFDDLTSELIEVDFRGTPAHVLQRIAKIAPSSTQTNDSTPSDGETRRRGRPKLGVVAREVTLLPRHWEWLATQPGGASVALRKLVEHARTANQGRDRLRRAQEGAYRFISTMAGNELGFEEAIRALFAGKQKRFDEVIQPWPRDVRSHAKKLAVLAFANSDTALSTR
jgi:hypothetical protein